MMSKTKRLVIGVLAFTAIFGVAATFVPEKITVAVKPVDVSAMDIELIKERMLERLHDPLSAQYVNTKAYEMEDGRGRIICTQYNSKNKLGGYVGFEHYMIQTQNDKFVYEKSDDRGAKKTCQKMEKERIVSVR